MKLYTILKDYSYETGHYVKDDPNLPTHKEVITFPKFLIIEQKLSGYFTNKYMKDGSWIGDHWHQSVEDAKHQAVIEFKDLLGEWFEIPDEVKNTKVYVFAKLNLIKKK